MKFSDLIPDKVLENGNTNRFLQVLDLVQEYKTECISDSLRVFNPALLMNRDWLVKMLSDYGFSEFPDDYPIQIVRQTLLNVNTLCSSRGSKIGVEFFCSLMSLGEVTIDDSLFYLPTKVLFLDTLDQSFLTDDNGKEIFTILDNLENLNSEMVLRVTIKSRYFNGDYPKEEAIIKKFIESSMDRVLLFSPNKRIDFTYLPREEFYFHKLLNQNFV